MKTASALSFLPEIKERKSVQFAETDSLVKFAPERPDDAVFEVVAIFDPASYDAQKMVPIIGKSLDFLGNVGRYPKSGFLYEK